MEQNAQTTPPTEEEILSYMFTKEFECPVCEQKFVDFVLKKSKLRTLKVETDFHTIYKDIDPNFYEVLFCTHCGYAALHSYFDKIIERQKQMIREKISVHHSPVEFTIPLTSESAVKRYQQALLCADTINAKPSQKAFINLKLAWILRSAGRREHELKFLRVAYEGLKEAFSTERFPIGAMDEATVKYVVADLARRLGDMGEAMRWVGQVIVAKGIPGALKERADVLKDLIREGNRM